ncbi:MAG: RecX family transcriptional regulator [Crocinitomicaceae bacterium]|nr:RecX family transcriptional regulator [Crocinitomicaceae bacterium]
MKSKYSLLEAKQKIEAYCAYQERCHSEVRKKLTGWKLDDEDVNVLISDLIQNNFLDEERFAGAFVSGKFRIKKWGRIKIKQHLKQKQISDYSIKKGMEEIEEQEYYATLVQLAESKNRLINTEDNWQRLTKLQRYLHSKGYETELIREVTNAIVSDQ